MNVAWKLQELRRVRGLRLKDAAERSGLGLKSISSFETGERTASMKLSQLVLLLRAYGVTVQEFFAAIDEGVPE